jgi:hypothetical protein
VADYLQDLIEQERPLAAQVRRGGRLLISGFDAAITTCIGSDRVQACTVLYDHPAFAQRQAQMWWNNCARAQRLGSLSQVRMKSRQDKHERESNQTYDVVYEWMPFALYEKPDTRRGRIEWLARVMAPGAIAFVVGPPSVADECRAAGVQVQTIVSLTKLPTFHMHQTILPRAQLKAGAMLYRIAPR